MTHRLIIICLLLAFGLTAQALADCRSDIPVSTPTSAFTLHQDGTATHSITGLMWMRCALGQSWNGTSCVNAATTYTWSQALQAAVASRFGGYSNWRLPNAKELQTIVEVACVRPSINVEVFPTSDSDVWFWSSSPSFYYPGYAWYVSFHYGLVSYFDKTLSYNVRLVRDGQ